MALGQGHWYVYSHHHEDNAYYVADSYVTGGIDLNGPHYWNNSTQIKNDTAAIRIAFDLRANNNADTVWRVWSHPYRLDLPEQDERT